VLQPSVLGGEGGEQPTDLRSGRLVESADAELVAERCGQSVTDGGAPVDGLILASGLIPEAIGALTGPIELAAWPPEAPDCPPPPFVEATNPGLFGGLEGFAPWPF
jgi:hypothetical protein